MKDISGIPNVDAATANLINGEMKDVATPGDGTGTPVRLDWQSDLYYALIAIMNEAGIYADNSAEGASTSQVKDAILRVTRKQVQGPSYSNLRVRRNVATPASKVDVTFDKLWIEGIEKTSGSYVLDITASGALGLDTGAEAADAWYYIWIIAKVDGTVSAILSASSTAPTMPAGYTLKRLVSMVRNTSGDFVAFIHENEIWRYASIAIAKSTATFISEELNCSALIPDIVKNVAVFSILTISDSVTSANAVLTLYEDISGSYILKSFTSVSSPSAGVIGKGTLSHNLYLSNRIIKYSSVDGLSATTVLTELFISGFEVPL